MACMASFIIKCTVGTRHLTRLDELWGYLIECLRVKLQLLHFSAGTNDMDFEPNLNYHVLASLFLSHLRE